MCFLGAYLGVLLRAGCAYIKTWRGEEVYQTYVYPNIVGCFLLGMISPHKKALLAGPPLHRLLWVAVAVGFCGSLTTFSGWQAEVSKLLLLQMDGSWGNIASTYQGARLLDFFVQQLSSFATALVSLTAGHHAAAALGAWPPSARAAAACAARARGAESLVGWSVLASFAGATALLVIVPLSAGWPALTALTLLGGAGAYARFQLSLALNARFPRFPLGTFIANVAGTWIYAGASALARFSVSYYDVTAQALLYGVDVGFCGCLTTMSTWVLELEALPRRDAYVYGVASVAAAALAPLLLLDVYSARVASSAVVALTPPPLDLCAAYGAVCAALLAHFSCPPGAAVVAACGPSGVGDAAWNGSCLCGALDASKHVAELLIDGQVAHNLSASLVSVWPADGADAASDVSAVVDPCLSYDNACDHLLHRISCPGAARELDSCGRAGLRAWRGSCACGGFAAPAKRVGELLVDYLLQRRLDLLPYALVPTSATANMCTAYVDLCGRALDHYQCPLAGRTVAGCTNASDYATWVGACTCAAGGAAGAVYDVTSSRVAENFIQAVLGDNTYALVRRPAGAAAAAAGAQAVDACATYEALCDFFLDAIGCPAAYRAGNAACALPGGGAQPAGGGCRDAGNCSAAAWIGACACGPPGAATLVAASEHLAEVVIDAALHEDLIPFQFFPPAQAPFSLVAASNPFRPLLAWRYPLPTQ